MMKDLVLKELNKRITKKNKQLEKVIEECKSMTEQTEKLDETLTKLQSDISLKETELDKLLEKQQKILSKYIPMSDYILQMDDGTYELVNKDDIRIIDDIDVIKKSFMKDSNINLIQLHFTDIDKEKYNELQEKDWCPFVDLMNYGCHTDIRFFDEKENKLIQLEWDIPEDDVIKLKDMYVKDESFWLEPNEDDEGYSFMALVWSS